MDYLTKIEGVKISPLNIIQHPKGNIFHVLKSTDSEFYGFGEVYISYVGKNEIKGWKKHTNVTSNIVAPLGSVKFVLYDDRDGSSSRGCFDEVILGFDQYRRLTIPPGIWYGFQGISKLDNMLLNITDSPHDPDEQVTLEISEEKINYGW